MKKGRLIVLMAIAGMLSSCTWVASTPSGIREFYRGNNGLVVTGKSKPNVVDSYHETQIATDSNALEALKAKLEGMGNE